MQITAYVLWFCSKLFKRLKEKIDKFIGVKNVMNKNCLTVDKLVDAISVGY